MVIMVINARHQVWIVARLSKWQRVKKSLPMP